VSSAETIGAFNTGKLHHPTMKTMKEGAALLPILSRSDVRLRGQIHVQRMLGSNRPISSYRQSEMSIRSCVQSVSAQRGKAGDTLNAHTELRAKRQRLGAGSDILKSA
jgi:hypothetical protein